MDLGAGPAFLLDVRREHRIATLALRLGTTTAGGWTSS
jgi:hypothetical protein